MDIRSHTSKLKPISAVLHRGLGTLNDGQTVVIIGGGPAGASCGIALKNIAQLLHKDINVILFEGKQFEGAMHYNQCVGVLSPPIGDILENHLKIPFPWNLVHRRINGYVLHSDSDCVYLNGHAQPSYAVRRVTFDDYLLQQAKSKGVHVIRGRVTDLEFSQNRVMVYSDSDNISADVVVGAFGLDDGGCKLFERAAAYQQPRFLNSIVTKIYPSEVFMADFGDDIHAFLPSLRRIEFGGVTPKIDHFTINIAGADVTADDMDEFLNLSQVKAILPPEFSPKDAGLRYFKGRFPISPAKNLYGDCYVTIGDAAGLVRPFKGKGINSGCITGIRAADTIMKVGISERAFRTYYNNCSDVTDDLIYGRVLRWFTIKFSNYKLLDAFIELAKSDSITRTALFNCVSAHKPFKTIYKETISMTTLLKSVSALGRFLLTRNHKLSFSSLSQRLR